MISQNCPKCGSNRVRHGYRPTPFWSKLFFRYHLLCDNCNWEFTGFAVPGTVSSKSTRRQKKTTSPGIDIPVESSNMHDLDGRRDETVLNKVSDKGNPPMSESVAEISSNGDFSEVEELGKAGKKQRKVKKKVKIRL